MSDTLLVVPARNEAASVPRLAALVRDALAAGVVDDAVVIVNGSTDDTLAAARAQGLQAQVPITAGLPAPVLGKGDALWRALVLYPAGRYVFIDADVDGLTVDALHALVEAVRPPQVLLAKGSFTRLQQDDGTVRQLGGRVTELLAKPLLQALVPELGHVREPLSGQAAIDGATVRNLPIVTGFGVEVALLLDVLRQAGPDAIASVELGQLSHRAKQDSSLVPMANEVATALLAGLGHIDVLPGGELAEAALPRGLLRRPPAATVTP